MTGLFSKCKGAFVIAAAFLAGLPQAQAVTIEISYELPEAGKVSMVICNAQGSIVRELLHASDRRKGRNTESWDGLDERGNPVPAGTYTWKLLLTQGLRAEYLLTLGTNPTPPWSSWPGNHNGVRSVAVDDTGMYLATTSGEGTILGLKQALDGRRIWSIPHWVVPWRGGHSMAAANGKLYMLHTNGEVHIFNAETGKHEGKWDLAFNDADRKNTSDIMDLDADSRQFVVSYRNHNLIRWINPADGSKLDEASVPEPKGVAVDPSGRVLVISNDEVVVITRENKKPQVLISGLTEPWRLDVEDATGDIFVVERGKSNQVKRFTKDGKLIRAYGKPGGRPFVGKFNPYGFNGVTDIAADQKGGFIVCEVTAPRRTVRVSKDGKIIRQWFGGQRYSNFAAPDPEDPTIIWMQSQWGTTARVKVDYQKKTWSVDAVFLGNPGEVRHHNGRTYICTYGMLDEGKAMVYLVDDKNYKWIPVADLSKFGFGKFLTLVKGFSYLGFKNNAVYRIDVKEWTQDGKPIYGKPRKIAEVPPEEGQLGSREMGPLTDDVEGNIYGVFVGGLTSPPYGVGWWSSTTGRDRVLKWDKNGKFLWAVGRHAPGPEARPGECKYLWGPLGTAKGCILARDVEAPVHVWDKDGLWVGNLFDNPDLDVAPIEAYTGPSECFFGTIYEVPDDVNVPGLNHGDVIFFASGQNNNPVFRISGWDKFWRQQGTITITPELAAKIAKARKADLANVVLIPHIGLGYMETVKIDGKLDNEWRNAAVLQINRGKELRAKVYLAWEVVCPSMNALHGLCAAFDVTTKTPWKSSSKPERAFDGGAAVELLFGPCEPDREAPGPGDVRLVAAPVGKKGKTVLVEFMPKLPPGWSAESREPQTYESSKGKITYDRVHTFGEGWVAARVKEDGSGYVVEMKFPLRPPLLVHPRLRFRFEAAVILADETGKKSVRRMPWHSKDPADATAGDVYLGAVIRPQNWAEGMLVARPSPAQNGAGE